MKNSSLFRYILSLLIFGTNGVVASFIPLTGAEIVLTRTILGSAFLMGVFVLLKNKLHVTEMKRQWKWMLISGASMAFSWVCLFEAYDSAGVSIATLEYYCGPVIVMALSPLLFKEKLTSIKVAGITCVIIGMVCINGSGITGTTGLSSAGLLYGVLSAVFYAVMIISNKKIQNLSGLELTMAQLIIAGILVAPYVALMHNGPLSLGIEAILAIIFLGIVNSGLACFLYFSSIHELPAQTVALCSYIDPLSTLLFSALFLNERLSTVHAIGAVLILGGAALGEFFNAYISSRAKRTACAEK
ncbi:MAG: DMT family transporter [Clostridium sp.]